MGSHSMTEYENHKGNVPREGSQSQWAAFLQCSGHFQKRSDCRNQSRSMATNDEGLESTITCILIYPLGDICATRFSGHISLPLSCMSAEWDFWIIQCLRLIL